MDFVETTLDELAARWERARVAAIVAVKPDVNLHSLNILSPDDFDAVLKKVFLNSRNLGRGYQKLYSLVWDLGDIQKYLSRLAGACVNHGSWSQKPAAIVLTRTGCEHGKTEGARYCQFWREAIDGLVMGLCDEERYARHSSITTGESNCEDVFYADEVIPTDAIWSNQYRWGTLPNDKRSQLLEIQEKFNKMKVDLVFLGVSENKLIYKLESREALSCGTAGTLHRNLLTKLLGEMWPEIELKDASPLAVYGEQA